MPARVVFADAHDDRVLSAVAVLGESGILTPVVVDPPAGSDLPRSVEVVALDDATWGARCAAELASLHVDPPELDALLFAALYTRLGGADAGVAGSVSTSSAVIRAGLKGIGLRDGVSLVSGCFLMELDGRVLTYADPAVVPDPTAEQLATIACAAADCHAQVTGEEPLVAMLSFSTLGSAEHPDVHKVRDAVAIVRSLRPDLCVDGELQFDVAVSAEVAARKCPDSPVAGRANVFVFPDLGAGNIAYKVTERLAGARATGSFVLGLRRPWVDLSRGCSVQDVVDAATAAARLQSIPISRVGATS